MDNESATWFREFRRWVYTVSQWFEWAGLVSFMVIVLLAVIDVIGSKFFKWPLPGSTEMTGVVQVVAISAGLAYSKIDGRHIRVGLLVDSLKGRSKAALELFITLLGLAFFIVAGWMCFQYGVTQYDMRTGTFLLGIVLYPFSFWIAVCCIPMSLVFIVDLITNIGKLIK